MPDPLCGWEFSVPASLAGDIAAVEHRILALNGAVDVAGLEGLGRFLLRAEAVGSSWLEGLAVSPRRLAAAAAASEQGLDVGDRLAAEVAANIEALQQATATATRGDRFEGSDLLAAHRALMRHSTTPEVAGVLRINQNWIGGSAYTPIGSRFVPPPPEKVAPLIADLIDYMASGEHSPLTQAALAHAQFETIHPFGDGNGRTGRGLIHVVLARRSLAPRFVPPVSVVLARRSTQYTDALQEFAHVGPPDSADRQAAAVAWLECFTSAMGHACARTADYRDAVLDLQHRWRQQVGPLRADSSAVRLMRRLPGSPVVTVDSASRLLGVSPDRVGPALNTLAAAGVISPRQIGRRRYRVFEARDVFALWQATDSDLAGALGAEGASERIAQARGTRPDADARLDDFDEDRH
ncbi:MAG: Fic family protein [Acidimicrobiia bacterium]|nr:Fic family protein [Acidimicrobiia bacterium]MYJ13607.1 Fic family protein [Acidimicrobiia bacterium]